MGPGLKRLGDMLIKAKVLSPEDLALASAEQQRTGKVPDATLVAMGVRPHVSSLSRGHSHHAAIQGRKLS